MSEARHEVRDTSGSRGIGEVVSYVPPVDTPLSKGVQPGSILPEISSASNVREMETYNRPLPICVYCVRIIAQGMCNTGCTIDARSVFEYAMKRDIFGDRVFFFLLKRERD